MGKPKNKLSAEVVARKKKKRLKSSDPKNNPFEVRVNRRKHDVLGQKIKSGRGLPGVSRSRAVQKRKKTLLLDYQSRHKSGVFVDKRFGEYNDNLSVEERAAQRFFLEKKKKRHGRFNLEDEDNEEGLTHFGQSLGDMGKFDDIQLRDGEMEEEVEDISQTHFGGFLKKKKTTTLQEQQNNDEPRSRKEIMNEIVAKSKQMKYERQSMKRDVEELMDTLDTQWEDVRGLITQPRASPEDVSITKSTATAVKASTDYDRMVRELVYERKAQATDRLKTEEETAREEKERLIQMEADRIRRMRGIEEQEEEDGDGGQDDLNEERIEHISADSINERSKKKKEVRFMIRYEDGEMVLPDHLKTEEGKRDDGGNKEMESGEEAVLEEEGGDNEEEEEETDEEDDEEGGSEEESDGNPAEQFGSDLESDGDIEEDKQEASDIDSNNTHKQNNLAEFSKEAMKELPYTFTMPTTLPELLALTTGRSPEESLTVVERIYSCYHPSLSPDNKKLLEKCLDLLIVYCFHLGKNCTINDLQTLNKIISPLFTLAQLNSVHTARVFRKHLLTLHKTWRTTTKNTSRCFPPFNHLVLFWLVGVVFPSSDFKHPITTPAMMIMGEILLKSCVKTSRDLLVGLSLCEIIITLFIPYSKRFIPELVNFISNCTGLVCTLSKPVFYPPFTVHCKLRLGNCKKWPSTSPPKLTSALSMVLQQEEKKDEEGGTEENPVITASAIVACLHLVTKLTHLYKELPSFPEIFSAITFNLQHASPDLPDPIKEMVQEVVKSLSTISSKPRPVLQLLKKKPKSIKFYEPSFDEIYDVRKRKASSKSVNERQKLKYKLKMERKGAIRELKKDTHFLSREKLKESRERDAEREKKTRQIVHDLQNIQHETKIERLTHHKRKR